MTWEAHAERGGTVMEFLAQKQRRQARGNDPANTGSLRHA